MSNSNNRLSAGLAFAAVSVSAVCLGTSLWQAYMFISGSMGTGPQSLVMIAGIFGVLLGSQVIARITGQIVRANSPLWCTILGVGAIIAIESVSISISTISFDGNLLHSSRSTNQQSPEYMAIMDSVDTYKRQIASLEKQSNELPSDWITRKREIADQIMSLQAQINAQHANARNVDVSVSDQAFSRMESTTGLGQNDVALIMGILLSVVPLAVNILIGALGWTEKPKKAKQAKESTPAKKPRATLRSVPA